MSGDPKSSPLISSTQSVTKIAPNIPFVSHPSEPHYVTTPLLPRSAPSRPVTSYDAVTPALLSNAFASIMNYGLFQMAAILGPACVGYSLFSAGLAL